MEILLQRQRRVTLIDSGTLTIAGTTTLTTSANNATITLDTTTNAFTGAVTITTNDDSGTDADVTIDGGTTALMYLQLLLSMEI